MLAKVSEKQSTKQNSVVSIQTCMWTHSAGFLVLVTIFPQTREATERNCRTAVADVPPKEAASQ